jgi:hypothetical protein
MSADSSFDDFWGYVIGCSAHGPFSFLLKLEFSGQSEISHFEVHVPIQKDVGHFEVAMDDV